MLEFGTTHAIRDVAISVLDFPFPLTLPSEILLGKELRIMALPAKSWPRASYDWITWLDRLSLHFQEHWESLGIAQFIKLTKVSITLDLDLTSTALRFWSKDLNSFIFSFGPASITLRDISIFTGFPVEGLEVVCLLDVHDPSLPRLEVSSTSQTSYSSALRKWRTSTGVPSTTEHIEFMWVLICHFLFFPQSGKPSMEYLPLARALAIGRPYALGTNILASVYQSMGKYGSELPYLRVGGALWFVYI